MQTQSVSLADQVRELRAKKAAAARPASEIRLESDTDHELRASSETQTDLQVLAADTDPLRAAVCKAVDGNEKFTPQSGDETIRLVMGGIGREQAPGYGLFLLQLINEHREFFTSESEKLTTEEARARAKARINNLDNAISKAQGGGITLDTLWNVAPKK